MALRLQRGMYAHQMNNPEHLHVSNVTMRWMHIIHTCPATFGPIQILSDFIKYFGSHSYEVSPNLFSQEDDGHFDWKTFTEISLGMVVLNAVSNTRCRFEFCRRPRLSFVCDHVTLRNFVNKTN